MEEQIDCAVPQRVGLPPRAPWCQISAQEREELPAMRAARSGRATSEGSEPPVSAAGMPQRPNATSVAVAEVVTLDGRADEPPCPRQDSVILDWDLGTKEVTCAGGAEWPEGER